MSQINSSSNTERALPSLNFIITEGIMIVNPCLNQKLIFNNGMIIKKSSRLIEFKSNSSFFINWKIAKIITYFKKWLAKTKPDMAFLVKFIRGKWLNWKKAKIIFLSQHTI